MTKERVRITYLGCSPSEPDPFFSFSRKLHQRVPGHGATQLLQRGRFRIAAGMQVDIDVWQRRQPVLAVQSLQMGRDACTGAQGDAEAGGDARSGLRLAGAYQPNGIGIVLRDHAARACIRTPRKPVFWAPMADATGSRGPDVTISQGIFEGESRCDT